MKLQRLGNSQIEVGPSVLGLVTRGICDNPLVVYREYLQNSADALARCREGAGGRIEIAIEPKRKRVVILDRGPGLSYQECLDNLLPVAHSRKVIGKDRGFRGIGRLSGPSFRWLCDLPYAPVVLRTPSPGSYGLPMGWLTGSIRHLLLMKW